MNSSGMVLRSRRTGPFRLVEKAYLPGAILPKHEHEREFVSFLLTGDYDEISQRERRTCSAGTVIWHPHTEAHADQFHSHGALLLDLEIDRAWLDNAAQALKVTPATRIRRGGLAYS